MGCLVMTFQSKDQEHVVAQRVVLKAKSKRESPAKRRKFLSEQGRRGGNLSAAARMKKLTPELRSEIAQKAAEARWAKWRASRYSLLLPASKERDARISALPDSDKYLYKQVVMEGCNPRALASIWGGSEAHWSQRVDEMLRKLKQGSV